MLRANVVLVGLLRYMVSFFDHVVHKQSVGDPVLFSVLGADAERCKRFRGDTVDLKQADEDMRSDDLCALPGFLLGSGDHASRCGGEPVGRPHFAGLSADARSFWARSVCGWFAPRMRCR